MKKKGLGFWTFIITYLLVNILKVITDFNYNVFTDKFSIANLLLDLAMWGMVYILVSTVLIKLSNNIQKTAQ